MARDWFLFGMATVYMFAFSSLYTQVPGLYGPTGLLPVDKVLPEKNSNSPWYQRLISFPSLVLFHDDIHLPPHQVMELCCLVGAVLALFMMAFRAMRCSVMFVLLWALYLSIYKVGQKFMWFQWDILLLEAGFLTILVAPFNLAFWRKPEVSCHTGVTMWLVKWLLLRLMFASGVVKLTSHCPTWWGLTALNYHYESQVKVEGEREGGLAELYMYAVNMGKSLPERVFGKVSLIAIFPHFAPIGVTASIQCIPTPLAWYAHQLPEWLQKLSVVGTYFIEMVVPLMFFLPVRSLRIFSFWTQVLLQLAIIVTGNYNFFNLLTIVLCFSLMKDDYHTGKSSLNARRSLCHRLCDAIFGSMGGVVHGTVKTLLFLTVVGYLMALTAYYFDVRVDVETWTITSSIVFSKPEFAFAVQVLTPLLAVVAAMSLVWEILKAAYMCLRQPGLKNKVWSLLQTTLFTGIVIPLFAISLVSHGAVDRTFSHGVPEDVRVLHNTLDEFSITSSYGLFRRMTGVGGRPELIIEGSNTSNEDDWKEYDFLYKPGALDGTPVYVAPHQPRLDWQMWFAALGNYQHNPWLVHLVYRLLIGQKEVLQLMADPPFKIPPRYIRARLYHYSYTPYDSERGLFNQTHQWWFRESKQEYLFPLTWDNQGLQDYLHKQNLLPEPNHSHYTATHLKSVLVYVRQFADLYRPPWVLWAMFTSGILAALTMLLLFPERAQATTPSAISALSPTESRGGTTYGAGQGGTRKRKR